MIDPIIIVVNPNIPKSKCCKPITDTGIVEQSSLICKNRERNLELSLHSQTSGWINGHDPNRSVGPWHSVKILFGMSTMHGRVAELPSQPFF